jgi:outer membrane lipoprotein-sorting protein
MVRSIVMLAGFLALAAGAAPADEGLLARMAQVNPHLHAFTATLHASVQLKSFPFLSANLVGTYYHKEPDKTKVVFSSGVPLIAQQFDKLYAHIESPSVWQQVYKVKLVSDTGRTAAFRLTPLRAGNVDHIDAVVNDKTATVASMRWNYGNGGYAEMSNQYGTVDGNLVVTSQTGHVEEPGYVADITSTIDNYTINPQLSDNLFTQ